MPVYRTPSPQNRTPGAVPSGGARTARPTLAVDVISHSLDQTRRIGQRLAALLQPGDLILLEGPFGAGKTSFAQGIARGLGVESGYITSPTFTLINEYTASLPLNHIDLYRLDDAAQALDLGLLEYLGGLGVTVIEWPERAAGILPEERLTVYLSDIAETKRALRFQAEGARYAALLEEFKSHAFATGAVPEPGRGGAAPASGGRA